MHLHAFVSNNIQVHMYLWLGVLLQIKLSKNSEAYIEIVKKKINFS